jgi:hypothetical protein
MQHSCVYACLRYDRSTVSSFLGACSWPLVCLHKPCMSASRPLVSHQTFETAHALLLTCVGWCVAYPCQCGMQVGHQLVAAYAACTGLPLYRRRIHGASTSQVRTSSGSSSSSGAKGSNHVLVQYTVCHDTGCLVYAFSRVTCSRTVAWICDATGGCLQNASVSPVAQALRHFPLSSRAPRHCCCCCWWCW